MRYLKARNAKLRTAAQPPSRYRDMNAAKNGPKAPITKNNVCTLAGTAITSLLPSRGTIQNAQAMKKANTK